MKTKASIACSEAQALENLVVAAARIVKNARWRDLTHSKINELRRPLLQLRIARQRAGIQLNEQ